MPFARAPHINHGLTPVKRFRLVMASVPRLHVAVVEDLAVEGVEPQDDADVSIIQVEGIRLVVGLLLGAGVARNVSRSKRPPEFTKL